MQRETRYRVKALRNKDHHNAAGMELNVVYTQSDSTDLQMGSIRMIPSGMCMRESGHDGGSISDSCCPPIISQTQYLLLSLVL